jgi:hypothetical protein
LLLRAATVFASLVAFQAVYVGMGYIIAIVLIAVVVPLLFMLLSRRTTSTGGLAEKQRSRGVTVSQPSSDQPTPRDDAINQPEPGREQQLPPG